MNDIFMNLINLLFIVGFILIGLACYFKFIKEITNRKKTLQEFNKKLKAYTPLTIESSFEQIKKQMQDSEVVSTQWNQYEHSLFKADTDEGIKIFSTNDAEEYFNIKTMTEGSGIGFWQNLAGVFTGVGLLGTFVGITFGLMSMDVSSNSGLQHSIIGLLGGTKTAFVTSVIGILLGLIYNIWYNIAFIKKYEIEVNSFAFCFNALFPRKKIEDLLFENVVESREQTEQIKSLSTDLSMALSEVFNADFKPLFEDILKVLEKINSTGADKIGEIINEGSANELTKFVGSLQTMQDNMQGIVEASVKLSKDNNETIKKTVQELVTSLQQSTTSTLEAQQNKMVDLTEQMKNLFTDLNNQISNTMNNYKAAGDNVNQDFKNSLIEVAKMYKMMSEQIQNSTVFTQKEFMANTQHLQDILEKITQNMDTDIITHQSVMKQISEDIFTTLQSSQELVKHAGDTADKFNKAAGPIQDVADSMGNQMSKIIEASNRFQRNVVDNTNKLNDTANKNMQNTVQTLQSLQEIQSAWRAYENNFKDMSGELEKTFRQVNKGIIDYNNATNTGLSDALNKYDESISRTLSMLQTLLDELNDTVDEIRDKTGKR